jgi:hypothetical protein
MWLKSYLVWNDGLRVSVGEAEEVDSVERQQVVQKLFPLFITFEKRVALVVRPVMIIKNSFKSVRSRVQTINA